MLRVFVFLSAFVALTASSSLAQKSQIIGVVLDSVSREPLVGANVLIENTKLGAATNGSGHFVIIRLDSGVYTLRCSFIGYASAERTVSVSPDDSIWLAILLSPEHIESEVVVVTGTRTLRSIADVPVRVEAIPEEEVEEKLLMTPSNVAMLLNESTGMRVQTTSAASSTANLRIQGLNGRYTQILVNGIPSASGLSSGFSLTQLVPLDLRQVEVLKGATSSLYGADAIAGVVNFLPKRPGEIPELNLLLNGTTQKGFDAAGFYSERFNQTGISILASHNRQARYDVDGDGFADVAQFVRSTITPRVLHNFSDEFFAQLDVGILNESRTGGAMDETASGESSSFSYTEKIKTNRLDVSSHIDWQPSAEQALSIKLAWLRSNRDALHGFTPFNATQETYFGDAQFSVDGSRHNFLLGLGFRLDDFQDRTPNISLPRSYRFAVSSLFLQDETHVFDEVTFLLSGRLDYHSTFGTFFVPRFSVMYRPLSSLTFRLSGGTGYKAPTIFVEEAEEIGFRNVHPLKNARVEKARSASFDLNWRGILGSWTVDYNSALFFTTFDDALIADEDSLQSDVVYLRNATGVTKSIGGELSLRFTYGDFKVSLGYTYLYATQSDKDRSAEMELNPRHSFGVVCIWESSEHQLKMGLENYWTSSQRVQRNPFRTTTPAYWSTGFIVEKGFGSIRLFVNFENIFDTRQTRYERLFLTNVTTGTVRTLPIYAPLEGRVINAGVRFVVRSE